MRVLPSSCRYSPMGVVRDPPASAPIAFRPPVQRIPGDAAERRSRLGIRADLAQHLHQFVPVALCSAAILFLLLLTPARDPGIFYSVDGALKYLVADQISAGNHSLTINSNHDAWVYELWSKGSYPFAPPFVYETAAGPTIVFPFLFLVISAAFLHLFGHPGLYFIPLLSLTLTWWLFDYLVKSMDLDFGNRLLGLAALVFSTPLTLYGAIYWEHTLGALLSFVGVGFLVLRQTRTLSFHYGFLLGAAFGLSIWIRPEAAVVLGCVSLVLIGEVWWQRKPSDLGFVAGIALASAGFALTNQAVYGHPLGLHSFQVIRDGYPAGARLAELADLYFDLGGELLYTFPLALSLFWGRGGDPQRRHLLIYRRLIAVVALTALVMPFILPNAGGKQWGPRYLLVLLPAMVLLLTVRLEEAKRLTYRKAFCVGLALGLVMNVVVGGSKIYRDYSGRIRPLYEFLSKNDMSTLVFAGEWVALELSGLFRERTFFGARSGVKLRELGRQFYTNGVDGFLFVIHPAEFRPRKRYEVKEGGDELSLVFREVGRFGKNRYIVYEADIEAR